jgi:phosphotransferase system HPr (HPr) family protein
MSAGAAAARPHMPAGQRTGSVVQGYKVALERMVIANPMGLDLRCAALLAQGTLPFAAVIEVEYAGRRADGKDVRALLELDAPCQGVVTVSAYGRDAYPALQTIRALCYATGPAGALAAPTAAGPGVMAQTPAARTALNEEVPT